MKAENAIVTIRNGNKCNAQLLIALSVSAGVLALLFVFAPAALAGTLNPGDIVVADSGFCLYCNPVVSLGGRILRVDPVTGEETVIASGGYLNSTGAIVIDATGKIIVSVAGGIISVDPDTGDQAVIASGEYLNPPGPIAIDAAGKIIVGVPGGIVSIDPATGDHAVIASGEHLNSPGAIVIDAAGKIIVGSTTGYAGLGSIIRVDSATGAQHLVSSTGYISGFIGPAGLAVDASGDIIVSNNGYGVGAGSILRIDPVTGNQAVITAGLVFPWSLAIDGIGDIIVVDSLGFWNGFGRIVSTNPLTGFQTVIAGGGLFVNPRGIAIVPPAVSSHSRKNLM